MCSHVSNKGEQMVKSNQRDRGRGGHPPASPMHDMSWLRTSENGKLDQAVDRVSRAMAGR